MPAIPLFMSQEWLIQNVWWSYLVTLAIANALFWKTPDHARTFFSPSAVMVNSTLIWFLMGSIGFKHGWVGGPSLGYSAYYSLEHLDLATSFFLSAVFVSVLALILGYGRGIRLPTGRRGRVNGSLLIVALAVLAIATFLPLSMSLLGGSGDFSSLLKAMAATAIALHAHRSRHYSRFFIYLALSTYLAVTLVEDKRIVVFFVVVVAFLEASHLRQFRLTFRSTMLVVVSVAVVAVAVVSMSIQRGHGQLGTRNAGESLVAIPLYFQSPFVDTLFINFEWTTSYFHSVNAVEYAIEHTESLLWGETYVKALMIPIPRSIAPFKPVNFLGNYTSRVDPAYRSIGGSWVPNAYAEAFGNFHYAGGLAAVFFIFSILNRVFNWLLILIRTFDGSVTFLYLTMYLFLFEYFRGYGLDGYGSTVAVLILGYLGISGGQRLVARGSM